MINPSQNQNGSRHANSQPANINSGVNPSPAQIAQHNFKMIKQIHSCFYL
jgi:hypothetical protein